MADATILLTGDREFQGRTPLFDVLVGIALASFVASIAAGEPALLGLGGPALALIVWSLARWQPVEGTVDVDYIAPHLVEGDEFDLIVDVSSASHPLPRIEVELSVSDHIQATGTLRAVTRLDPNTTQRLTFRVQAKAWGVARVDKVTVRVTDTLGLFGGRVERSTGARPRVGLPEDRLGASLQAERFRRVVGSHLSNDRGEGLEIADIRPWLPGDSTRDLNWRISNRRGEPWVTLRHPDRSTTVVVIVDAHDGDDTEQLDTQRRSVAAAMTLARGHLAMHDPVGLLVVGHSVKWLAPRLGRNQLHRIADELISVSDAPDASLRMYRPPALHHISREAVVVAVSPLRDPLMVQLVAELRSRGNHVAVLVPEVDETPRSRAMFIEGRLTGLARKLAALEHCIGQQSLRARGVVLVRWERDQPVTAVMRAVERLRQSMRRSAA